MPNPTLPVDLTTAAAVTNPPTTPNNTFNVRFEVLLKKKTAEIEAKFILTHTMTILSQTKKKNETFTICDIHGNPVPHDLNGVQENDIPSKFSVKSIGKNNNLLVFGLTIQSTASYTQLKERSSAALYKDSIYMKLHKYGFTHGAHWVNLGFFMNIHPIYGSHQEFMQTVINEFAQGWTHDNSYWDDNQKTALMNLHNKTQEGEFDFNNPPMIIQPNNVTATNSSKQKIRTYASTVMVPGHLKETCKMIMDYLYYHKDSIPHYIPIVSQRGKRADALCQLLEKHNQRLTNHRNIQILNVPNISTFEQTLGTNQAITLHGLLGTHGQIDGFKYEPTLERLNVSVSIDNYTTIIELLNTQLQDIQFPFNPTVKLPRRQPAMYGNIAPTDASYHSMTTDTTMEKADDTNPTPPPPKPSPYAKALAFHCPTQPSHDTTDPPTTDKTTTPSSTTDTKSAKTKSEHAKPPRRWEQRPIPKTINFSDMKENPFQQTRSKPKKANTKENKKSDDVTSVATTPTSNTPSAKPESNPDTDQDTLSQGNDDSVSASTMDKTWSTITSKQQQEIDDLRSELHAIKQQQADQNLVDISTAIAVMQKKQEAMEIRIQQNKTLEQRIERLLDLFEGQTTTARQRVFGDSTPPLDDDGFEPVTKKSIKPRAFPTPQKPQPPRRTSPPSPVHMNQYDPLKDNDEDFPDVDDDIQPMEEDDDSTAAPVETTLIDSTQTEASEPTTPTQLLHTQPDVFTPATPITTNPQTTLQKLNKPSTSSDPPILTSLGKATHNKTSVLQPRHNTRGSGCEE